MKLRLPVGLQPSVEALETRVHCRRELQSAPRVPASAVAERDSCDEVEFSQHAPRNRSNRLTLVDHRLNDIGARHAIVTDDGAEVSAGMFMVPNFFIAVIVNTMRSHDHRRPEGRRRCADAPDPRRGSRIAAGARGAARSWEGVRP